jgi:hypothetical protein
MRHSGWIHSSATESEEVSAAATHTPVSGMPLRPLPANLGYNSLEVTQLSILEDEAEINGTHSPFDLLHGVR